MSRTEGKEERASLQGSTVNLADATVDAKVDHTADESSGRAMTPEEIAKEEQGAAGTFWDYLGGRVVAVDGRQCVAELEIKSHHLNIFGMVHGGVYGTLLDSVMGIVVMASRPGEGAVTTNLNIHFTAPMSKGRVRVEADIVHAASRTITAEGRVLDENGTLCAFGTGTFRVVGDKLRPKNG